METPCLYKYMQERCRQFDDKGVVQTELSLLSPTNRAPCQHHNASLILAQLPNSPAACVHVLQRHQHSHAQSAVAEALRKSRHRLAELTRRLCCSRCAASMDSRKPLKPSGWPDKPCLRIHTCTSHNPPYEAVCRHLGMQLSAYTNPFDF